MPAWLDPTYEIGTYLLTAIYIWWERDRLLDFHIDKLAIMIIILFKPLQTIFLIFNGTGHSVLAFPHWPSLILWGSAVGLFIALRPSWGSLPKITPRVLWWFAIGAGAGVMTAIVLGYPMSFQVAARAGSPNHGIIPLVAMPIILFPYQLGYAAVSEEPLFRGFLWGRLRKLGWKDVWIWLFQAGLFTLAHIYYLNGHLISLWIIVPVGSLVFGALAWRSRTIAASMAAHGFMNTLGYTMGLVFAYYRMRS